MEQATLLELLDHVGKLTEVVEKMSTNIVILNGKLDSNTKKVDRLLLKRDLPTSLVDGRGGIGRPHSEVPMRPPAEQSSANIEVVNMRDVAGQGAARTARPSNSTMSTAETSPASHDMSPDSGRPLTARKKRRASVALDATKDDPPTDSSPASHDRDYSVPAGFDDIHPTTRPVRRSGSGGARATAPPRAMPDEFSNTNIHDQWKAATRNSFAEAFNNTKSHMKTRTKPKTMAANAFPGAPNNTLATFEPKPEQAKASTVRSKHAPSTTQKALRALPNDAPSKMKTWRPSTAEDIFGTRKKQEEKRGHAVKKAKVAAFNKEASRKRQRMIDQLDSPNAK